MSRERMIFAGVGVLLLIAMLAMGANSMQQNAWMEGYTFGRLAASAGEGAALAPILPYGMGMSQRGPGFGGVLFLLLGFGALFFVGSRIMRYRMWREWAAQNPDAPQPPWMMQHRHGCWGQQGAASATPAQEQTAPAAER